MSDEAGVKSISKAEKTKAYNAAYYLANKAKIIAASASNRAANPEKYRARASARYSEDKKRVRAVHKAYYLNNKGKSNARSADYRVKNKEKLRAYFSEYQRNRRNSDPLFKLKHSLRNRLGLAIKAGGYTKSSSTGSIIGCSYSFLKAYLETRFKAGMTWGNYGVVWHIDHVVPLALAKTKKELMALCKYTNLNPEFAEINLSKGSKVTVQQALNIN